MRSHLLTSAAMLLALLATAPVNAEEEAATTQAMDAGMAEAAAEQAAMEAEVTATEQETMAPAEPMEMESETSVSEEVTGTVMEMTGPAALPPPDVNIPARGMHMEQVEQMYGKPMGINPPVGEPPITRWDYPGFAVYFEYSYVIQSVPK